MDEQELRAIARAVEEQPLEEREWVAAGVEAFELTSAILEALVKRLGPDFVDDVEAALRGRINRYTNEGDPIGKELAQLLEHSGVWTELDRIDTRPS